MDTAYSIPSQRFWLDGADLATCRVFERLQVLSQTFYTPLRLRAVLRQCGFTICRVELSTSIRH